MKPIIVLTTVLIFCMCGLSHSNDVDYFFGLRESMVQGQIVRRGVNDAKVLDAMREVPRHLFVPKDKEEAAYQDHPLSIGHNQTISQPYIVGFMSEAIEPSAKDKILEIGTGSGYQAAVLSEIVNHVYSVEIVKPLADEATARLKSLGYENITVKCDDGFKGWVEHSPFDKIIVTAAPKDIPEKLVEQLKVGGKMIIPVGSITQELILITKTEDGIKQKSLLPVRFVPMITPNDLPQ